MRTLTTLALLTVSGALLAQQSQSPKPVPVPRLYVDGIPQPSLSARLRASGRPQVACPMPVVVPPDSVELAAAIPAAASRLVELFTAQPAPTGGMPTVGADCYNPLFLPTDSTPRRR